MFARCALRQWRGLSPDDRNLLTAAWGGVDQQPDVMALQNAGHPTQRFTPIWSVSVIPGVPVCLVGIKEDL